MTVIARPRGLAWPKTRRRVTPPRLIPGTGVPVRKEAVFQAEVLREVSRQGYDLVHFTRDSRGSPPGFPDLVIARDEPWPRVIVAELKVHPNQLDAIQRRWLHRFRRLGFEAYEWRDTGDIRWIADLLARRTPPVDIRPLGAPGRGIGTIQEQSMGIAPEPLHRGRPPSFLLKGRR